MNIDQLKKSNFLKRSDVGPGVQATVTKGEMLNVAKEGAEEEMKFCLSFAELEKPMVMNATNLEIMASIAKNRDTDHWIGTKVVLYDDPNISFGGKLVGGIRLRAPRRSVLTPAPAPRPAAPDAEDTARSIGSVVSKYVEEAGDGPF